MRFLVFDVGCIECGESSAVVGIYATREEAERAVEDYAKVPGASWGRPEWYGQHYVDVFDLPDEPVFGRSTPENEPTSATSLPQKGRDDAS